MATKEWRIGHSGDWHLDLSNLDDTAPAVEFIVKDALEADLDIFFLGGDLFVKREHIHPMALDVITGAVARLGEKNTVISIPGNHDAMSQAGGIDSVSASISRIRAKRMILNCSFPQTITHESGIHFTLIPTPNKYHFWHYLRNLPDQSESGFDEKAVMADLLGKICRSLAGAIEGPGPRIIGFHGTVLGGKADSEMVMGTGHDIALPRGDWEDTYILKMAAHLHHSQNVNGWQYCGAPAPLTFANRAMRPVWLLHRIRIEDTGYSVETEARAIPVARQMIQIEITADECMDKLPADVLLEKINQAFGYEAAALGNGCRLKIVADIPEAKAASWGDESMIAKILPFTPSKISVITDYRSSNIRIKDADSSMKIDTLMQKYIDLNDTLHPIREDLMAFTASTENAISPEARMAMQGAEFRPISLEFRNWKQFGSGAIDFTKLGRLTCISGMNTAGKSNAIEAEAFCLFKYLRGSSSLSDVIRHGQKQMEASFTFESRGDRWRITRKAKATNAGATSDLLLEKLDGSGNWVAANREDQRGTQAFIESLVGPQDLFLSMVYARQFDIDRILNLRPAELKDLVQDCLPLQLFEYRNDLAAAANKKAAGEFMDIQAKIKAAEAMDADTRLMADEIDGHEKDIKIMEADILEAEEKIKDLSGQIERAGADIANLKAKAAHAANLKATIMNLTKEIDGLHASANKINSEILKESSLKEDLDSIVGWNHEANQIRVAKMEWQRLEADAVKLAGEIKLDEANQMRAIEGLEEKIDDAATDARLLGEVPCEGSDWERHIGAEYQKMDGGSCRFLKRAKAQSEKIPELESLLVEAKAKDMAEGKRDQLLEIRKQQATVDFDAKRLQLLESLLAEKRSEDAIRNDLKKIDEAKAHIQRMHGTADRLRDDLVKAEADLQAMDPDGIDSRIFTTDSMITTFRTDLAREQNQVKGWQQGMMEAREYIGRLSATIEAANKAKADLPILHDKLAAAGRKAEVIAAYMKAVSRDGIPFLMLEAAIPRLEEYANHFLASSPVRLSISTDLGGKREEISISFSDEKGSHSLSEASGYQRNAIGVAIRAALNKIQAELIGTVVHHFFIDEGFGAYDGDNILHGKNMLKAIADDFQKVLFITHVDGMKQMADSILEVSGGSDGSTIKAVV